jgi:hypothetical protein
MLAALLFGPFPANTHIQREVKPKRARMYAGCWGGVTWCSSSLMRRYLRGGFQPVFMERE